jgi:hypothetical protein
MPQACFGTIEYYRIARNATTLYFASFDTLFACQHEEDCLRHILRFVEITEDRPGDTHHHCAMPFRKCCKGRLIATFGKGRKQFAISKLCVVCRHPDLRATSTFYLLSNLADQFVTRTCSKLIMRQTL